MIEQKTTTSPALIKAHRRKRLRWAKHLRESPTPRQTRGSCLQCWIMGHLSLGDHRRCTKMETMGILDTDRCLEDTARASVQKVRFFF